MNDLKDVLEQALADGHGPDPALRAEPGGDLARGRRLLRRRRLLGLTSLAGGAAVVAAVAVPLSTGAGPTPAHQTTTGIALVAYRGAQPAGYQVSEVPSGWVIQGGNAYALVLAPRGDNNTSINVFVGKLVVMLQSKSFPGPGPGKPQPVAGRPGRFDVQGDTEILTYTDQKGAQVVIQAPTSLDWNAARLAQFAAGVQVLHNAKQGLG
ncbi:MAG TPA: hypothetical protein VHU92_16960 [Streptosporangiaceae bacterium]|jgi:hypothetical protein|nr:hypothetical protein [Streptosporangiaceae bacterium]